MLSSYFDAATLRQKITWHKDHDKAPAWLLKTIEKIAAQKEAFKPLEDENRYIAEFVYPH